MGELGAYALILATAACVWGVVASVLGARRHRPDLVRSAEGAIIAAGLAVTVGGLALVWGLVSGDFSLQYVVEYTSRSLSVPYRIGAFWAGQGGSLLLWAWMLAGCSIGIVLLNRRRHWGVSPYALTALATVIGLFAALSVLVESPFTRMPQAQPDGQGLNPLLQNYSQIIHPLALYGGYVAYTIPFALAIGGLASGGRPGRWMRLAETWNLWSWIALTAGIVLGARWAYAELGWGGYWGWDPVENASLLPWLTGTALLHTGMTDRKTGRPRVAGLVLVMATFVLCLFGTFLTRSGVVSSVHAFGKSNLGPILGTAIMVVLAVSGALLVWRLPELKGDRKTPAKDPLGHQLLTWLLIAITGAVLWGTMYPLISRLLKGQEIAVTAGFFRVVVTPLGVALLGVLAAGPLLPGARPSNRRRELVLRVALGAVVASLSLLLGGGHIGVAFVLALAAMAMLTVGQRMVARVGSTWAAGAAATGSRRLLATLRTAGPYIAHVGLVVLLAAVTVNVSYQREGRATLHVGEKATVGGHVVSLMDVRAEDASDHTTFLAVVSLATPAGQPEATVGTRQVLFANRDQPNAEVGIAAGLTRDLYVVLESADLEQKVATVTVFTNPAVVWIWVGGMLLILGGLAAAVPARPLPALPAPEQTEPADDREKEPVR